MNYTINIKDIEGSYSTAHSQLDKHVHATREWRGVHVRGKYTTPMLELCWKVLYHDFYVLQFNTDIEQW